MTRTIPKSIPKIQPKNMPKLRLDSFSRERKDFLDDEGGVGPMIGGGLLVIGSWLSILRPEAASNASFVILFLSIMNIIPKEAI